MRIRDRRLILVKEIEKLSRFAATRLINHIQAMQLSPMYGLKLRWNYLLWVIDQESLSSADLLQQLELAILTPFFTAITSQAPPRKHVLDVLTIYVRLDGVGINNSINMSVMRQNKCPIGRMYPQPRASLKWLLCCPENINHRTLSLKHKQQDTETRNLTNQSPSTLNR